jgi:hypothetical protein
MKLHKITMLLAAAACCGTWICGARAFGASGGLVIYKNYSFDPDSQAEITDYTSYDRYPSVDNVLTPSGQTLQITPGQEPIYIPHAGDPKSNSAEVSQTILTEKRRFPQFAAKLEWERRAWAAAPSATPKPSPAIAAAPQPTAPADAVDAAPSEDSARVLHTKSGDTLTDWKLAAVEGDTVVITHADGISRIPITDLPDNLFGFPQEVMDRAQQLRQQAADQARMGTAQATPSGIAKTGAKRPGKGNHHRPGPTPIGYTWE